MKNKLVIIIAVILVLIGTAFYFVSGCGQQAATSGNTMKITNVSPYSIQ